MPPNKKLTQAQLNARELELCRQEIARLQGVISTQSETIAAFKTTIHLLSKTYGRDKGTNS